MKKILALILAVLLIAAMAVPAYAVTPKYEFPDIPDFSDIKFKIDFKIPDKVLKDWFDDHPINWKPVIVFEGDDDKVEALKRWLP